MGNWLLILTRSESNVMRVVGSHGLPVRTNGMAVVTSWKRRKREENALQIVQTDRNRNICSAYLQMAMRMRNMVWRV